MFSLVVKKTRQRQKNRNIFGIQSNFKATTCSVIAGPQEQVEINDGKRQTRAPSGDETWTTKAKIINLEKTLVINVLQILKIKGYAGPYKAMNVDIFQ